MTEKYPQAPKQCCPFPHMPQSPLSLFMTNPSRSRTQIWFISIALPALRHFKIHLHISFKDNISILAFLKYSLSIPRGSTTGIQTLEIKFTCHLFMDEGELKDLFSPDAGWSALDEVLTSEKFVSLRMVVLSLKTFHTYHNMEEYVDVLFPSLRASRQRTLETYILLEVY